MPFINAESKEIHNKVIYYGPKGSGKSSCLKFIKDHSKKIQIDYSTISLKKETNIDMLVFSVGKVLDFETFFHIYSFPDIFLEKTSDILRNCDGLVFVVNSDSSSKEENKKVLQNLIQNFQEDNIDISRFPMTLQYNKRDKQSPIPINELRSDLNLYNNKDFESSVKESYGIMEPFNHICRSVLVSLRSGELP